MTEEMNRRMLGLEARMARMENGVRVDQNIVRIGGDLLVSGHVSAELADINKCKAKLAAAQSIATSTHTSLYFAAEDFDLNAMHDNSTLTERVYIKTAGIYAVHGYAVFAADATGIRSWQIWINSAAKEISTLNASSASAHHNGVSGVFNLAENDYVELIVYQNSGAALNVNPASLAVVRLP